VPFKVVKARAKARGNPLPGSTVEAGQTTLDGKTPTSNGNGTNGAGMDGSADDTLDDESGPADPNAQLEMEIRGLRTSSGSVEGMNGNEITGENDEHIKEDVEMS
jgi:hypothetical protein